MFKAGVIISKFSVPKQSLLLPKRFYSKKDESLKNSKKEESQKNSKKDESPKNSKKDESQKNSKKDESSKKAGVILSGCGHLDGTCVYETASAVFHLCRNKLQPVFYAPTCPQADVVDHKKGCPVGENRCAITEGARLARGKIFPLCELNPCDVSCIVVPGGFGVAKTLSTFESDKAECAINADLMKVLEEFHDMKKPMGFICISAILPARLFPCVKVTLGKKGNPQKWPYQYAIDCATQMGAEVEPRAVDGFSFDKQHMVFSTPAFMYTATYDEVNTGIGILIENMIKYID